MPVFLAWICTCLADSGVIVSKSGLSTCTRGMFFSSHQDDAAR